MIAQHIRDQLRDQIRKGDYEAAAKIYQKNTNRTITPRYLQKFINGQKNPTGQRQGAHQPLQMYDAIADAVAQRQATEQDQTAKALQILQNKIRIDKPTQPIPL